MINNIDENKRKEMRESSVLGLPDNPKAHGISGADVKKAMVQPFIGVSENEDANTNKTSIVEEVNRIVEETNAEIGEINKGSEELKSKIEKVEEQIKETEDAINEVSDKIAEAIQASEEAKDSASIAKEYSDEAMVSAESVKKIIEGAPESLDTLKEIAEALNNDENLATNLLNELAKKVAKDVANEITGSLQLTSKASIQAHDNNAPITLTYNRFNTTGDAKYLQLGFNNKKSNYPMLKARNGSVFSTLQFQSGGLYYQMTENGAFVKIATKDDLPTSLSDSHIKENAPLYVNDHDLQDMLDFNNDTAFLDGNGNNGLVAVNYGGLYEYNDGYLGRIYSELNPPPSSGGGGGGIEIGAMYTARYGYYESSDGHPDGYMICYRAFWEDTLPDGKYYIESNIKWCDETNQTQQATFQGSGFIEISGSEVIVDRTHGVLTELYYSRDGGYAPNCTEYRNIADAYQSYIELVFTTDVYYVGAGYIKAIKIG